VYIPFSIRLGVGSLGLGLDMPPVRCGPTFLGCCGSDVRRRRGCGEARSSIGADFFVFYGGFPVSAGGGGGRFFPGSGRKVEVALLLRNKFLRPSLHFVVFCSGTGDGFVRLGGHRIWDPCGCSSSGCLLVGGLLLVHGGDPGAGFFFLVGWFAWCFSLLAVASRFGWASGGERMGQFDDPDG